MDDSLSSASTSLPQHISLKSNNYSTLDKSLSEGFKFHVTYLGSVEILISMKVLDFNTRKAIARWFKLFNNSIHLLTHYILFIESAFTSSNVKTTKKMLKYRST